MAVTKHSIQFNANVFRKYYGFFSADVKIYPLWSDSDTLENLGKIGAGVNMGIMIWEVPIGTIMCSAQGAKTTINYSVIGAFPNHGTSISTGGMV